VTVPATQSALRPPGHLPDLIAHPLLSPAQGGVIMYTARLVNSRVNDVRDMELLQVNMDKELNCPP
jgi:hypothetical protein